MDSKILCWLFSNCLDEISGEIGVEEDKEEERRGVVETTRHGDFKISRSVYYGRAHCYQKL